MKKNIWLSILCTFLTLGAFAQSETSKTTVLWGKQSELPKGMSDVSIIGSDDTGYYGVKSFGTPWGLNSNISIERYNGDMHQTKSVNVDLKYKGKEMEMEGLFLFHQELYLFSSYDDEKLKIQHLFVQKVDKKSLRLDPKKIKVSSVKYLDKLMKKEDLYYITSNHVTYSFRFSRDSSKLLLACDILEKGSDKKINLYVFDEHLTQLWEKEIALPYEERTIGLSDWQIDNEGNVFLLGKLFQVRGNPFKEAKFTFQLFGFYEQGSQETEYPIAVADKYVTDAQIYVDADQKIVCSGLYAARSLLFYSVVGYYFKRIDGRTNQVESEKAQDFEVDFMREYLSDRDRKVFDKKIEKGKEVGLYDYRMEDIVSRADGGTLLIADQNFAKSSLYTVSSTTRYTSANHSHDDIIVISLSPDGALEWAKKIRKRQRSLSIHGTYRYAMAYGNGNGKVYFSFNDHANNLSYDGDGEPVDYVFGQVAVIVLVEMDRQGEQKRRIISPPNETQEELYPFAGMQCSEKEWILFSQKKKDLRWTKVLLE